MQLVQETSLWERKALHTWAGRASAARLLQGNGLGWDVIGYLRQQFFLNSYNKTPPALQVQEFSPGVSAAVGKSAPSHLSQPGEAFPDPFVDAPQPPAASHSI